MTLATGSASDPRLSRTTGAAGLLVLVLIVPTFLTEDFGPQPTMSPAHVAAKLSTARTDVLVSSALLLSLLVAFFVFAVGLSEIIRNAGGTGLLAALSRSSAAVGVGIVTVYTAIFASLASSIHHVQNVDLVYGVFRAAYAIDSAGDLFLGMFMAASAVPLARAGLAGKWLTRFTCFGGVVYALGSLSIITPDAGIPGACEILGTVSIVAWVVIISIRLLRAPGDRAPQRTPASPLSTRPQSTATGEI